MGGCKQENSGSVILRLRETVWIPSALGGKGTLDEAEFHIVNVLERRAALHQDQDFNNVALPLSRRHTRQRTRWNSLAVRHSPK